MEITPNELRECEITKAFRGLDETEVHDLLDRAADTIEALQSRVRQLSAMAAEGQSPVAAASTTAAEPTTAAAARTLELAQRVADETIDDAKATAATIVSEAETTSSRLVADAQEAADRVRSEQLARAEAEIAELDGRRSDLSAAVQELETFERDYRDKLLGLVRDDLARFERRSVPDAAPAAASEARDPEPSTVTSADNGPPTELVTTPFADGGAAADLDDAAVSEDEAGTVDASAANDTGIDAEVGDGSTRAPLIGSALDSSPTVSNVEMATIDLAHEQAAELDAPAQLAAGGNGDDDDFFTSLREATSEHAALAPGEPQLFDSDDDRDSTFRDVFRRRR